MILTGPEIHSEWALGRIVIDPYYPEDIEPNSYGFHLGPNFMRYETFPIDAYGKPASVEFTIPRSGYCLRPGKFYLGSTLERIGSDHYAATLYATRSVSTLGMWIQFSAPLGHTGAIIPWTLEIMVVHPTIVYPGMRIGKIAFWHPQGERITYEGKYRSSDDVVASRLYRERLKEVK